MTYFSNLSTIKINNPLNTLKTITVPNLLENIKFNINVLNNKEIYNDYYVINGERPDQISHKIYQDTQYYWIILLSNNIFNYAEQWSLSDIEIDNYINIKYKNPDNIKHYETKNVYNNNGLKVLNSGIIVSEKFSVMVDNIKKTGSSVIEPVTYRETEYRKNEAKKNIKVMKPNIVKALY